MAPAEAVKILCRAEGVQQQKQKQQYNHDASHSPTPIFTDVPSCTASIVTTSDEESQDSHFFMTENAPLI
eukprot:CAMPEP_0172458918 /NCGR_PEP_ID=MMETSP1065-20121228/30065_1 /TAXON_ID=265537 /ORGANISM="Amphiprora paludosa, Strain CCMP125" /LENGTH=69 /DNA_ID=CAMNT_0013213393 /DNA_START=23 /DNA_END=232 /DNA_ORIENTATION=-